MQSVDILIEIPSQMQFPEPQCAEQLRIKREEILSWCTYPDEEIIEYLSSVVGEIDSVRVTAERIPQIREFRVMPIDNNTFYTYAKLDTGASDTTLLDTFDDQGLMIVPPVVYTDVSTIHVTVLGTPDALSGLLPSFPSEVDVSVIRVSDHRHTPGTLAGRLTNRQLNALEVAFELGYYDVPRTASLATVADELGCSKSAASSLLRGAETKLVETAVR